MARNRKKGKRLEVPVQLIVAIVLLATLALLYVWLDCRCKAAGKDIVRLEAEKEELANQLSNEQCRWAQLKSPASIEQALRVHQLAMDVPRQDQIVRLGVEALRMAGRLAQAGTAASRYGGLRRVARNE